MHSNSRISENTSTPKRRRLGTGRICRPSQDVFQKNFGLVQPRLCLVHSPARCESPPIPCNQIEYLCDSSNNNSSTSSNIPPSPGFFENSLKLGAHKTPDSYVGMANLKSRLITQRNKVMDTTKCIQDEIENLSDDMFQSRLEIQESYSNNNELLTSISESNFRQNIEDSFDLVNQSICGLEPKNKLECELEINNKPVFSLEARNNVEENDLFQTKDSFLLDIKDNCEIIQENVSTNGVFKSKVQQATNHGESFYGLPLITKGLFKTFRSIDKFYDWQEECLNLDAIKERRNLIYALPTSGGKTLVAEVLMLREVLNGRKNALFILPFVAIVQEKIWALSPFAVQLGFLVEEYAAGKGHIPPKKRRRKNSIYIATIEKALALVRSLIEFNRLNEIGLIVVDELHLIGEAGRGSTLETLLTTVIYANQGIQIVGMSATIGNLPELAHFLSATVFERHFRPVELAEYVKRGDMLHRLRWREGSFDLVPERALSFDYSPAATALDPDWLGGLVSEVTPAGSCLVFCPTKRNCENVAALLCKMQRKEMSAHRATERRCLSAALVACGASAALCGAARCGVAWHHAGLANDERALLEDGFRTGVISVLCCTSTLAAGVNLPAQRVIIRAPLVGREPLSLAAYRQMAGRAGRKGQCEIGESIIICGESSWPLLQAALAGGVRPARSQLAGSGAPGAAGLLLSALALRLACTRGRLCELLRCTLMHVQADSLNISTKQVCDDAIRSLLQGGAIEVARRKDRPDESHIESGKCHVYNDSELIVSSLGNAAIKGCLDLAAARLLLQDLETASRGLVLLGSVHLLYLVTPQGAAGVRPDLANYYTLYCNMNDECLQTAKTLGITEKTAIRMMTGKPITNVPESVLARFYLALVLYDLWNQVPFCVVVEKYNISRGTVQQLMTSAAATASCASRVCEQLEDRWAFRALFSELATRLQHCGAPELAQLLELPGVKKTRALQLSRAGYKRIEDVARASTDGLLSSVAHLSRTAAEQLISAARLLLIEKVENLRSEAEDVMEELNIK